MLNLVRNLENAILNNDGRSMEYFTNLISRLKYHRNLDHVTLVPIDLLLLPKTPRYARKGSKRHRKKPQHITKRRCGSEPVQTITKSETETYPERSTQTSHCKSKHRRRRGSSTTTIR